MSIDEEKKLADVHLLMSWLVRWLQNEHMSLLKIHFIFRPAARSKEDLRVNTAATLPVTTWVTVTNPVEVERNTN